MIGRYLQDRSYLVWQFFDVDGVPHERTCDFMENITVKESSKSRMGTHSPIGRNGSVYVHMGSDSREFNLQFKMTLPNIIEHTSVEKKGGGGLFSFDFAGALDRALAKTQQLSKYIDGVKGDIDEAPEGKVYSYKALVRETDKIFQGYLDDREVSFQTQKVFNEGARDLTSFAGTGDDPRTKAIAKVLFWLNLIRVSTMTHSQKPWLGPPILRLTHGLVYQNVPCIAKSWNVEVDGAAGYDNRTLLPRVIKVSMNLSEVRLNNDKFKQYDNPDGLIGWDVFTGVMDNVNKTFPVFLSMNEVNIYEGDEEEET